jgi:Fe-S-cluster containining protein
MAYEDTLAQVKYDLKRESAFSYQCNACSRCCHNKTIRITPYEILRLARRLGISTTDFITRHTEAGGTVLRTRDDDWACIFLSERGCGVHPDRPLACRLYPLARWIDPDGTESFGHLTPHPNTAGIYGVSGTVARYLEGQGVGPFFAMGDRYGALYQRMVDVLESLDPEELGRRAARRDDVECR